MTAIINGSSPTVTFSDGTTQATSAIVSGYVPYANLPTGSVLQVVNGNGSTVTTTTSATYVTTGITATITPKFVTSKILVIVSGVLDSQASGVQGYATIYRGGFNIFDANGFGTNYSGGARLISAVSNTYLDSPATTSATTYTIYIKAGGGTVAFTQNSTASITLLEIAG
jgi:hypothetical protein